MSDTPPLSPIPGALNHLSSPAGYHRRGIKVLVFGESNGGKSKFLASMPRPLAVIDSGAESGIQPYLRPCELDDDGKPIINLERVKRGEEDVCFTVTNPVELQLALDWILANQAILNSVGIDGITNAWEDHRDFWQDELGKEQLQGGDWKKVKGPWKKNLKALMQSRLNVALSAHLRDLEYSREAVAPGVEGKLTIKPQEVPAVEKNIPYIVDLTIQMSIARDEKNRPTPIHIATLAKGRRPESISPKALYVGMKWRFDERAPENPWDKIIAPIFMNCDDSMAVDYMGMHEVDVKDAEEELRRAADDSEAGRMLRLMHSTEFKSMPEFKGFWEREIAGNIDTMAPAARREVLLRKEEIKKQLSSK